MHIDWSAYKITLFLYLGILMLPISFYFSYNSFSEIQSDTKTLNTLTINSALILTLDNIKDNTTKEQDIKNINKKFQELRPWMVKNNDNSFYIASEPLIQKYDSLLQCFKNINTTNKNELNSCWNKAKPIIFSLNNMLNLKQNSLYNVLYINFFIAVALLITLVFLLRAYIHKQLSKHAIYDFKTKLFNKDYLLATIKEISARSKREGEPLSVLYLKVKNLDDKKLGELGSTFLSSIRESDVACRYGEDEFIVILPNTILNEVTIILNRIDTKLNNIKYTMKSLEHYKNESYEDFIARFS